MALDAEGNRFTCEAGREADFGGRWKVPCELDSINVHTLVTAVGELTFCDLHMHQLIQAGLITDPFVSREGAEQLARNELEGFRYGRKDERG